MSEKIEIKNVYVCHYHEDRVAIKKMEELLGDEYRVVNSSVTPNVYTGSGSKDKIKSILRPLIESSSVLICLIGPDTDTSEWIDWEIRIADMVNKHIIGVYIPGAKDSQIPRALEEFAEAIVCWKRQNVIAAINGSKIFEKSDCSPREVIKHRRHTC